MIIKRTIYPKIKKKLQKGKVVILYGPRQVGKTFLLKKLENETSHTLFLNGESATVKDRLSDRVPEKLETFLGDAELVIIDEAHRVPAIGMSLKMMVDSFPQKKFIASGSASFELAQKVGEPLTGRRKTLYLYPVSAQEIIETKNPKHYFSLRDHFLIYGSYPELFRIKGEREKKEYLAEILDSYLFREILEVKEVRGAKKLRDLLTLLAFQIGKEVSHTELGNKLDLNKKTVSRYLDLLEKSFVIKNIRGFSRNLRKEVTKTSRYYFWDNGIRNAVINNFNSLKLRDDKGMLWENYLVTERLKKQAYSSILANNYFWRTYDQKEIDWVEEREGKLWGYEIKWGREKASAPRDWLETYENANWRVVNKENFLDFIGY